MRKGFLLSALLMPLLVAGTVRAGGKDQCGDDLKCDECPSSNWYVGVDLAVLKPHMGTLGASFRHTQRLTSRPVTTSKSHRASG